MGVRKSIATFLLAAAGLFAQTPVGNPPYASPFVPQQFGDASGECKACHPRQYFEMKQAVHFGYRNISPLFNGLEVGGNFLTGGLLRPVYHDSTKLLPDGSPLNTNMFSTPVFKDVLQVTAGFCYTCHQAEMERKGENPDMREVPEIPTGKDFRPDLLRPLRDYHMLDANGNQVLPDEPGGPTPTRAGNCGPPEGHANVGCCGTDGGCAGNPLSTTGISCDSCHNVGGPDLNRSFQHDGFANMSMILNDTKEKVAQFLFPIAVGRDTSPPGASGASGALSNPYGAFHVASNDPAKINFINNAAFCNSCHDVRVPRGLPGDVQHKEASINPGGSNVSYYRLENLGTEWQTGPFSGTNNPFGQVIICHDCHTSLFPHSPTSTYTVGDMTVTVASPGLFPMEYAAIPGALSCIYPGQTLAVGVLCANTVSTVGTFSNLNLNTNIQFSTDLSPDGTPFPLQKRVVSSHYFTGVDIPLIQFSEMLARLGPDSSNPLNGTTQSLDANGNVIPDPGNIDCSVTPCFNEYGQPRALETRREDLLKNAVRISLKHTDTTASLGGTLVVRAEAVALTGHRFPAGLSQERTTYIQLDVTDDNGFKVYQSGYVVDKPHPLTGENAPDGNLDDEDLEHVHLVVDPGRYVVPYQPGPQNNGHTNQVLEEGPDSGPSERLYFGTDEGLVLWRNELQRFFLPGESLGRNDANGNPIVLTNAHLEELVSADLNNTVDNYRSLQPLHPRTFRYNITLPTQQELAEMGVTLKGPLHVHAQVNFEHFPPMMTRFVIRTTGGALDQVTGKPTGPSGHDMHLFNEQMLDTFVKNIRDIAHDDFTVNLQ